MALKLLQKKMNGRENNKHKGINFENYVEQRLTENDINVSSSAARRFSDRFEQHTEIDRLICDRDGRDLGILEIKSGTFTDVHQAQRLVDLAQQEEIELIFATPDGTTDKFSQKVVRELEKTDFSIIDPDRIDNKNFANSTRKTRPQRRKDNR